MTLNEVSPPGWGHTKAEKEKTKPNKPKSKIGGSAADKAKVRAHQAKVDKENAAARSKDPSQGRYPKG